MQSGFAGMEGTAPVVEVGKAPRPAEAEVYRQIWGYSQYRAVAPGEQCANQFLQQAEPLPGSTVIDFGCGTGRGALMLALFGQMNVTMMDFTDNCLDDDIRPMLETQSHAMRFVKADLTNEIPSVAQYGFCTDVMEHIPPADVDHVLDNILHAAEHCYFQISTVEDSMGVLIGHPLHLSIHPFAWWLQKFIDRGCIIHWSKDQGQACSFYVTAWIKGQDMINAGVLNIDDETIRSNVRWNTSRDWQQVIPHETNDMEVMILGGGYSLNEYAKEIADARADGIKLITLNGAYNWALEQGLTPSAQIVVDARQFNERFTHPVVDDCKYLIASQCNPDVLKDLPKDRTWLWHTCPETVKDILNEAYPEYYPIPGGSTVLLRAIPLLRMLGFKRFHLYGCDSCLDAGLHHAYEQPENDSQLVIPVTCGSRIFQCHPWMFSQAQEFIDLIRFLGHEIELEVHGDGLLTHILRTGADLHDKEVAAQPLGLDI